MLSDNLFFTIIILFFELLFILRSHALGRIRINSICLPFHNPPEETWEEYDATVAGWGATEVNKHFRSFGKIMFLILRKKI